MVEPAEFDVVIVGLGPTGATLANLLAQCGVQVLVLEKEAAIYNLPRAVHFDDETMRVFQTTGIASALTQQIRVNPGMRFVDPQGNIVLDWPRPQQLTEQGWHASYRLHQPDLERLLRQTLTTPGHCRVLLSARLTDATASPHQVNFTYDYQGQQRHSSTRYMVGCDGANSSVRQLMHTALEDLGFKERWLVVDILLHRDMPELGDHTIQYCDPHQPMTYCRNPGNRRRWEMALPDQISDTQALDEPRIWQRLSRWITPQEATIERKATYTFRSAVAADWQAGRWLIAGDAAHLTPPFMGQGMCAGIRDAANLGWKLAMAIKHPHLHKLLSTYQHERSQHVTAYIATAVRLGELINTVDTGTEQPPDNTASQKKMASLNVSIGSALAHGVGLPESPLNGSLFTQPALQNKPSFDDFIGYHFALISSAPVPDHIGVTVLDANEHPALQQILQTHDAIALLIRPDRYIASAAHNAAELQQLIAATTSWFTGSQ